MQLSIEDFLNSFKLKSSYSAVDGYNAFKALEAGDSNKRVSEAFGVGYGTVKSWRRKKRFMLRKSILW